MAKHAKKFAALPAGYDDIGAVLKDMGDGFEYEQLSWDGLRRGDIPKTCEVLFINCGMTAAESSYARDVAATIRAFVHRGGSLYVSDYAGAIVQATFPQMIEFEQDGVVGTSRCDVVDPGLQEQIGKQIQITFDLPGWWRITGIDPAVRVYVQRKDGSTARPVIVGFSHGAGHVIYTSFHNKAQVSAAEQRLLRFLVLRPILAQAAASASAVTQALAFVPGKEIIATIDRGQRSLTYVYEASGREGLSSVLQWEGEGTLQLIVQDPSGAIVQQTESNRPPLQFAVARAVPGTWSFVVSGTRLPYDNFPYVLTLGTRPASEAPAAAPRAARGALTPLPASSGRYAQAWSSLQPGCLILLIDRSESMNKPFGGTRLGAGQRKCDIVATMTNKLIDELIQSNRKGDTVSPRADIAIIGYEGATVRSALGSPLSLKPFVSLPELAANPLRVECRMRREVGDDGVVVEQPVYFPIWVEPVVGTTTPMCAALQQARDLAGQWAMQHASHYPPVIINITDGASTDGDPADLAHALCNVTTADGSALLFNCHISDLLVESVEFPPTAPVIPQDSEQLAPLLWALSSLLPRTALTRIEAVTSQALPVSARGFIFNGDAGSIQRMFLFVTVAATRPLAQSEK